jgi:DNA repair exonuclease SbcCD nuclease subunit
MKLAISGDWHFHAYKENSVTVEGKNSNLLRMGAVWTRMVDEAIAAECDVIAVVGDVFHVRGSIKPSVFVFIHHLMSDTAKRIPILFIPGNHDMEDYRGGATAIDTLCDIPNVYVAGKTSTITLRGIGFLCVPYHHNIAEMVVNIAEASEDYQVVLMHQGIDNFKPSESMPNTGLTVESLQSFFGKELPVFSGHYHSSRRMGNIYQVGAPMQHHFGDEGDERGFLIYDTEIGCSFHNLNAARFVTVGSKADIADLRSSDFVRIKSSSASEAAKLRDKVRLVTESVSAVIIERKYEASTRASIKVGNVRAMLEQWIKINPDLAVDASMMMRIYDEATA